MIIQSMEMTENSVNYLIIDPVSKKRKQSFDDISKVFMITKAYTDTMDKVQDILIQTDHEPRSPLDENIKLEVVKLELSALENLENSEVWCNKENIQHSSVQKKEKSDFSCNKERDNAISSLFEVDGMAFSEPFDTVARFIKESSERNVDPACHDSDSKPCDCTSLVDQTENVTSQIIGKQDAMLDFSHSVIANSMPINRPSKKLLILDINGLLADIVSPPPKNYRSDINIARRAVFKRPFCFEFLSFCFERFDVGIWSSRKKKNVERVTDYLLGHMKQKLLFCWDLSHCTVTGLKTLENKYKDLVCKELKKIWKKDDPNLPFAKGFYDESNTLLLDDSPYKSLLNPPYSAIFPQSYTFEDRSDNSLGSEGDIRLYLEKIYAAENVQKYVEQHPFGQSAINESSSSWDFYNQSSLVAIHRQKR